MQISNILNKPITLPKVFGIQITRRMVRTVNVLLFLAIVVLSYATIAQATVKKTCDETEINDVVVALKSRLKSTPIREVSCSDLGLYKITAGDNVFYTDAQARFLLFGSIYDLDTQQEVSSSFTEQAVAPPQQHYKPTQQVNWDDLPLGNAIVIGDGDMEIAIFKDINCPYCRRQYMDLKDMPHVKVYYMIGSIFGERSAVPSEKILCSDTPQKWLAYYMQHKSLPDTLTGCEVGKQAIAKVSSFAGANGWSGTPTTVRKSDGAVQYGYKGMDTFKQFLAGGK